MCFFKKKKAKIQVTNNKYQVGEFIRFRYKGEVNPGVIYDVEQKEDGSILYQVQIGGECPIIINNVLEKDIFKR